MISASYWWHLWVVQELLLVQKVYFAGLYNLASWESVEKTAQSDSAVLGTSFWAATPYRTILEARIERMRDKPFESSPCGKEVLAVEVCEF